MWGERGESTVETFDWFLFPHFLSGCGFLFGTASFLEVSENRNDIDGNFADRFHAFFDDLQKRDCEFISKNKKFFF